jgi:hypothetical protein
MRVVAVLGETRMSILALSRPILALTLEFFHTLFNFTKHFALNTEYSCDEINQTVKETRQHSSHVAHQVPVTKWNQFDNLCAGNACFRGDGVEESAS